MPPEVIIMTNSAAANDDGVANNNHVSIMGIIEFQCFTAHWGIHTIAPKCQKIKLGKYG